MKSPADGAVSFLSVAAIAVVLASCASQAVKLTPWRVEPVLDLQHTLAAADAQYAIGRYYDKVDDSRRAIDAYRQALVADPHYAEGWNALGVVLAKRGDLPGAVEALKRAVAEAPTLAHLYSNLGYALLMANRPADAIGEFKQALRLDPANPKAFNNLREALKRTERDGEPDAAAAWAVAPTPAAADAAERAGLDATMRRVQVELPSPTTGRPIRVSIPLPITSVERAMPAAMQVLSVPTVAAFERSDGPAPPLSASAASVPAVAVVPVRFTITEPGPEAMAALQVDAAGAHVELRNGNGVAGAAAWLRDWLSARGVPAYRLSNQRPYTQQRTLIQYRPGKEAEAHWVESHLPSTLDAGLEPAVGLPADVRVLIGHDWAPPAGCPRPSSCAADRAAGASRLSAAR